MDNMFFLMTYRGHIYASHIVFKDKEERDDALNREIRNARDQLIGGGLVEEFDVSQVVIMDMTHHPATKRLINHIVTEVCQN